MRLEALLVSTIGLPYQWTALQFNIAESCFLKMRSAVNAAVVIRHQ